MRLLSIIFSLLCIIWYKSLAQSPTPSVDTYLSAIRQGQHSPAPKALWQNPEQHTEVLTALSLYYTDTLTTVRAKAYYLTKQIGTYSQDHTLRQQVVAHPGTTR